MNPRFSIIIPLYNAEKHLLDCINSIKAQTYSDFEVIMVDDGSTDETLHKMDFYRDKDDRFHIYHQEHAGVSSARNLGLQYAVGNFICFVDADDQIASTYLSDLYQAMGDADSSM